MTQPTLEVCLSPALLHLHHTAGKVVVIIDVFRANSTIAAALHQGATAIVPVASVEDCIALGAATPNSITAGEREGKVAPGLAYGNSPAEYPTDFVTGKTLVLTTTNGTRLLHMVQGAAEVITGAFLNLSAVCDYLSARGQSVILACAAWKDRFNMEDALFAGAVAARLQHQMPPADDATRMAIALYAQSGGRYEAFLRPCAHWHRLASYGQEPDLIYCSTPDLHPVVPVLRDGRLVIA